MKPSEFSFDANRGKNYIGDHVEKSDALFNVTDDDMTMNGSVPWRGAREKNQPFFQLLIQQFSEPGDVVLDCKAATGMLCCKSTPDRATYSKPVSSSQSNIWSLSFDRYIHQGMLSSWSSRSSIGG
jgi:hypothetical protein